jgi:hypothetical protein
VHGDYFYVLNLKELILATERFSLPQRSEAGGIPLVFRLGLTSSANRQFALEIVRFT